ncbi:MAG: hypothetical protein CSB44_08230 [Gammaproteobacteria bacterium]|nr:MAG: hypothetical protein CSB44_08230 [Gammaproteobacteria bacterium]
MAHPISRFRQRLFRHRPDDTLPAVVTHQRIYILPSGRGFTFLLALLLMLVAAINYSLSLGYALCFLLMGLHAAALIATYRNLAGLCIESIRSGNVHVGELLVYDIALSSGDGTPRHGIELRDRGGHGVALDVLPAQGENRATIEIPAESRGPHALGRLTLASDWPLGLWRAWSYLHTPAESLVYPKPEPNPPPVPVRERDGGGADMMLVRQGEFAGLREYRDGDSPNLVAWKQAARGQGLLVRLFDDAEGRREAQLSLAETGLAGLEAQLSRIAAWVQQCEQQQRNYAMKLGPFQLDCNHGPEQRHRAFAALALHGVERHSRYERNQAVPRPAGRGTDDGAVFDTASPAETKVS